MVSTSDVVAMRISVLLVNSCHGAFQIMNQTVGDPCTECSSLHFALHIRNSYTRKDDTQIREAFQIFGSSKGPKPVVMR